MSLKKYTEEAIRKIDDIKIIGTSKKNVEGPKIVNGEGLFGIDFQTEDMLISMIEHPPAFLLMLDHGSLGSQNQWQIAVTNQLFSVAVGAPPPLPASGPWPLYRKVTTNIHIYTVFFL